MDIYLGVTNVTALRVAAGDVGVTEYLMEFCAAHGLKAFRLARAQLLDGRKHAPYAPLEVDAVAHEQEEWLLAPVS